jgi:3',5'-cyclic AMP phosphodiesterase CpdA
MAVRALALIALVLVSGCGTFQTSSHGVSASRPGEHALRSQHFRQAPQPALAPFHFVQITDTHHGHPLHLIRTRMAVDAINALPMPIEVVLHTGDLASNNLTMENAAAISNEFSRLNAPVVFVPGNHDILPKRMEENVAAFRAYLGPLARRVEHGGAVFLALYTEPLRKGNAVDGYDPLDWLGQQLSAEPRRPTFVVHHAPDGLDFYRNKQHEGWPDAERQRWQEVLSRGNVRAIIAGHFHRDELQWNELGIPTYISAGIACYWDRQGSFRIYTYADGRLTYQTVYIEDPPLEKN